MKEFDKDLKNKPVEIAAGIFWVGYEDDNAGLHCNPYLLVEGEEAVLIDGGSRDDFSRVMLKILRTGISPSKIGHLIYQHYDPDLCESLPQLEAIINNENLRIISLEGNNIFIHYYSALTPKLDFRAFDNRFVFATGRTLEFYPTPFCHAQGSFVTYDIETRTLFSSDLFGSFDNNWDLFLSLEEPCADCRDLSECKASCPMCPMKGMKTFHQNVMTSNLASRHALELIGTLDIDRIAPQHGSIIESPVNVKIALSHLQRIKNVGIEYALYGDGDEN